MYKGTIIVATSRQSIIGRDNQIPWHHSADLKRFKALTLNSTIIMGRKTFESIGRALPKRRNVVISRTPVTVEGVETFPTMKEALATMENETIWFIGGKGIYLEAMQYCQKIDLTIVPDTIERTGDIVEFPWIDPTVFNVTSITNDTENSLQHITYERVG